MYWKSWTISLYLCEGFAGVPSRQNWGVETVISTSGRVNPGWSLVSNVTSCHVWELCATRGKHDNHNEAHIRTKIAISGDTQLPMGSENVYNRQCLLNVSIRREIVSPERSPFVTRIDVNCARIFETCFRCSGTIKTMAILGKPWNKINILITLLNRRWAIAIYAVKSAPYENYHTNGKFVRKLCKTWWKIKYWYSAFESLIFSIFWYM